MDKVYIQENIAWVVSHSGGVRRIVRAASPANRKGDSAGRRRANK